MQTAIYWDDLELLREQSLELSGARGRDIGCCAQCGRSGIPLMHDMASPECYSYCHRCVNDRITELEFTRKD